MAKYEIRLPNITEVLSVMDGLAEAQVVGAVLVRGDTEVVGALLCHSRYLGPLDTTPRESLSADEAFSHYVVREARLIWQDGWDSRGATEAPTDQNVLRTLRATLMDAGSPVIIRILMAVRLIDQLLAQEPST